MSYGIDIRKDGTMPEPMVRWAISDDTKFHHDFKISDNEAAEAFAAIIDFMVDTAKVNPQAMMVNFMGIMQAKD